jgi:hypothetical protein
MQKHGNTTLGLLYDVSGKKSNILWPKVVNMATLTSMRRRDILEIPLKYVISGFWDP